MWTRAELKTQAKAGLKNYYWQGLLACIVSYVVSYGVTGIANQILGIVLFFLPFIGSFIAGILISTFLSNPLTVGEAWYFLKGTRTQKAPVLGDLFHCFKEKRYMTVVKVMFMRGLFIWLWSLLLVVPGWIKHYEYLMVPYLAVEYPDKSWSEIFAMSKQMMTGNKGGAFVLDVTLFLLGILASIPMIIVAIILLVVIGMNPLAWIAMLSPIVRFLIGFILILAGPIFVYPYKESLHAELYLKLRQLTYGIPREDTGSSSSSYNSYQAGNSGSYGNQGNQAGGYAQQPSPMLPGPNGTAASDDAVTVASGAGRKQGFLVGIQGEFSGANVPVGYGSTLVIGRDPQQCSLVIHGEQVSRVHLKVEFDGNAFRVMDLSTNGTFDLQAGRLPKNQMVLKQSGTYLQIGSSGDIFMLECR